MVQRSCTKTNNDVRKQGGGDDKQSPYLKFPHTSKEKRKRNASGKVLRFWLVTLSRGLSPKSLRLLPFLLQQLKTSFQGSSGILFPLFVCHPSFFFLAPKISSHLAQRAPAAPSLHSLISPSILFPQTCSLRKFKPLVCSFPWAPTYTFGQKPLLCYLKHSPQLPL